jgi:tight adherence protein B
VDGVVTPAPLLAGLLVVGCGAAFSGGRGAARSARVRRRLATVPITKNAIPTRRVPFVPAWLAPALADADLPLSADRAWAAWLTVVFVGVVAGAAAGGPVLAVGAGAVAVVGPLFALRARRGTAATRSEAALPGALEAVARGLRSGGSLRQALAEAARTTPGALGTELDLVAAAAERGTPLVEALEAWSDRCPRPGVRLAVAALCLGAETGGAQARAVDGVAATLRERLAVAGEVRALTSQTRASMLVIAAAPLAFCAFASATDPRTSTFLFRSPVGLACLAAGLALDAAGACWMRRLCRTPS